MALVTRLTRRGFLKSIGPIICFQNVLAKYCWNAVDCASIETVTASATNDILHYQADGFDTERFRAFLTENRSLLDRCHRVYCDFDIVYPKEVEIQEFIAILRGTTDAEVLWEGHQAIRSGCHLEMNIVCSFLREVGT